MNSLLLLVYTVLDLYWWVIVIAVIMTWLIHFNVINIRNDFVNMIYRTLIALTEPVLRPIRRVLPTFGGIDLSPLVVLLAIYFLKSFILYDLSCMLNLALCPRYFR